MFLYVEAATYILSCKQFKATYNVHVLYITKPDEAIFLSYGYMYYKKVS